MSKRRKEPIITTLQQRENAKLIANILDSYVASYEIPLKHHDHFTLLCAVLLSAQCTDERVNKITPQLFKRAATPAAMAQIDIDELEALIRSCGLYRSKAAALKQLSQILLDEHAGKVPCDIEALERLPGVGHKTASVVMVQAFGVPAFPVDTHIARCAYRWGLTPSHKVSVVECHLKQLFPEEQWGRRHLQIILFARKYCPARGHILAACPICSALTQQAEMHTD